VARGREENQAVVGRPLGANCAGHGVCVQPGCVDVEDGEVGLEAANSVQRLQTIARHHHRVAATQQQLTREAVGLIVILGDQDPPLHLHGNEG
jgi:hypothetical protein